MKLKNLTNQFKSVLFLFSLLLTVTFFQSCNSDADTFVTNNDTKTEISEDQKVAEKIGYTDYDGFKIFNNVKVIKTTENLIQLADNSVTFAKSEQINAIKKGDIIVGDIMPNAPYGFIRKVVSISNENNNVSIQTEIGSLDNVVADGEIDINELGYELYYEGSDFDFQGVEKLGGIDELGQRRGTISKTFNYSVNKSHKGLYFRLNGSANIKFYFYWKRKWFKTKKFETWAQLDLRNTVVGGIEKKFTNKTINLKTAKLPNLKFWVGPVPIIIRNKFYIDYATTTDGRKVEIGATLNYRYKLGVQYDRSRRERWKLINQSDFKFYPFVKSRYSSFNTSLHAPIVGLKGSFYGYKGATVYTDIRQVTNVTKTTSNVKAKIAGHTRYTAGARLSMLGFRANPRYEKDFWHYTKYIRVIN